MSEDSSEKLNCMAPTVKHKITTVMIWIILWNSLGSSCILHGKINGNNYFSILVDHVYPVVQTFPYDRTIFQDNNSQG